jgi:hypothetical protein
LSRTIRSTTRFQVATELPAALTASMLGMHIDVAAAWQRVSSGDWMTYAADVSRRPHGERVTTDRSTRPDPNSSGGSQ